MLLVDWLGTLGVSLLLIGFLGNLFGKLDHHDRLYQGLNAAGAGVLMIVSMMLDFIPFIVLEGIWMVIALLTMFRIIKLRA